MVRWLWWSHTLGPSAFPRCVLFRPTFLNKEAEELNSNFPALHTLVSIGLTIETWFIFVSGGADRILKSQALKHAGERPFCSLWPLLRGIVVQWEAWKGKKEVGPRMGFPSLLQNGQSRFVNQCQNWAGQGSSLLQAVIMKASICQQRLSATFPAGFLPTDSLSDATSNVYDLTVDHHGTSTNRRLLRRKTSRERHWAPQKKREKDPYSRRPQVKTEHPIPHVDTSTSC